MKSQILMMLVAMAACAARAQFIDLSDGSVSAVLDPDSQAGLFAYNVDGIDQVSKQWLWVGEGESRFSIDAMGVTYNQPSENEVILTYSSDTISLEMSYALMDGGGLSTLENSVTVSNKTGVSLDLSLFLYGDWDLGGTASGDLLSGIIHTGAGYESVAQVEGSDSVQITLDTPAQRAEGAFFANTLNKLNFTTDDLSSAGSSIGPIGPGDMTFAFQWDLAVDPAGTDTIAYTTTVIPEPASLSLIGLFIGCIVITRRLFTA